MLALTRKVNEDRNRSIRSVTGFPGIGGEKLNWYHEETIYNHMVESYKSIISSVMCLHEVSQNFFSGAADETVSMLESRTFVTITSGTHYVTTGFDHITSALGFISPSLR